MIHKWLCFCFAARLQNARKTTWQAQTEWLRTFREKQFLGTAHRFFFIFFPDPIPVSNMSFSKSRHVMFEDVFCVKKTKVTQRSSKTVRNSFSQLNSGAGWCSKALCNLPCYKKKMSRRRRCEPCLGGFGWRRWRKSKNVLSIEKYGLNIYIYIYVYVYVYVYIYTLTRWIF